MRKRAHTLAHLTKLYSTKFKSKWNDVEHNHFISMQKILGCDVLLSYPNFSEIYIIHTEASKTKLGGFISQNGKLVAFHSCKLTPAQINYTTTEKKLLSIV